MRKRYHQKRDAVIDCILSGPLAGRAEIMEQDAGLHFLMRLDTALPDETLRQRAAERGLRLALLSDYYRHGEDAPHHVLVVNYSGIELVVREHNSALRHSKYISCEAEILKIF